MTSDQVPRADGATFDQELLSWLGDEPPEVRAADAGRIKEIAAEFAAGFARLAMLGPRSRSSAPRARRPSTPTTR